VGVTPSSATVAETLDGTPGISTVRFVLFDKSTHEVFAAAASLLDR
jgi:hypothetical protein